MDNYVCLPGHTVDLMLDVLKGLYYEGRADVTDNDLAAGITDIRDAIWESRVAG